MEGNITLESQLSGIISVEGSLSGTLDMAAQLSGLVDPGGSSFPPYEGDYDIVPKVDIDQVLPTANHRMMQDLTVERIPIFEAHGPTGGITITIGE